ncbi:MAG TPA: DUF2235 domain-containing protein [Gammaproteobacteria bacterium]
MAGRHLVLCFDGTWNTPDNGPAPTNVVKLLRALPSRAKGVCQIVFYDKGVGTGNFTDKIVGGASGVGLTENIIDGYRFLGNNYAAGDEIYIFGFSRGAYTARSLAGLIALAGILKPEHLGRDLRRVIEICRSDVERAEKQDEIRKLDCARHEEVRIRCVGVWDTVGSLGIPGDLGRQLYLKPYYFYDVELSPLVDVGLHAIAIDEKRSAFAPTLWGSADGKPHDGQIVEQVWFPGVHSNVGGSYPDAGLSDIALDWMVKRLKRHTALAFDDDCLRRTCNPRVDGMGYESRSALYVSSKVYPYQRLINQTLPDGRGLGEWFRETFEKFDRRNLMPEGMRTVNEMLHISALDRWALKAVLHDASKPTDKQRLYRPPNLEAVIRARNIAVVGRDGERLPADIVPWPSHDERPALEPA